MSLDLKKIAKEKIILFDGAMGTSIQKYNLSIDDFDGKEGCNEILNFTRPEIIKQIHGSFLKSGCDIIETNSFGSNYLTLKEYELENKTYEISKKSAEIAKNVCMDFSNAEQKRYTAGSIGPGTKLPSLLHVSFDELQKSYKPQIEGLIDGGADLLIVETCQDLLQAKIALISIYEIFQERRIKKPVICQVTIEQTGTMLLGSDIMTAIITLSRFPIDVLGLNCALGPEGMQGHIEILSNYWDKLISVIPNAGLPKVENGIMKYDSTPNSFSDSLTKYIELYNINIVGGCCGTTPQHIEKLHEEIRNIVPKKREFQTISGASSLYGIVPYKTEPKPLIIGERANPNGSKKFRECLIAEDFSGMINILTDQEKDSHILDICTAYTGKDEMNLMKKFIEKANVESKNAFMIDSTEIPVISEALKRVGGKAIVNSINLEDGGNKLRQIISLCKKFGAGVVALTIDEEGMAKTSEKKIQIAKRIYEIVVNELQFPESDIFFDCLTFTIGSGDNEYRDSAIETINAINELKKIYPNVNTILGLSNISFGLEPKIRQRINSLFLHFAIEKGLDSAILHSGNIMPIYKISEEEVKIIKNLIFNIWEKEKDPLIEVLNFYSKLIETEDKIIKKKLSLEENLKERIINGNTDKIEEDLNNALKKYTALEIINNILLEGMKQVGELFSTGKMQLPFVLKSAETMKKAVSFLEPFIEKNDNDKNIKKKIVIATVKGDVHDIGKNLVDIILTNNGYNVINIGIKQNIESILKAYEENNADIIGMSGLLVRSTIIMKENLEVMNNLKNPPPVILGGAALTRDYVTNELQGLYKGKVYYAQDAFEGLNIISEKILSKNCEKITKEDKSDKIKIKYGNKEKITPATPVTAPFIGVKKVENISLDDIFPFLNKFSLYDFGWGYKKNDMSSEEYKELIQKEVEPNIERLFRKAKEGKILIPKVVYGYFPCNCDGNKLLIYKNMKDKTPVEIFDFPRQDKENGYCLSDYFQPIESGIRDIVAFHVVTMGENATLETKKLLEKDNYKEYLLLHSFSVEMTEALAEYWHKQIRKELKIDSKDAANIIQLFSCKYQGSRFSFGYSACPNLEDQKKLFHLLNPEQIGVHLTQEMQMVPEQSTSAIIVHNPSAKYFST